MANDYFRSLGILVLSNSIHKTFKLSKDIDKNIFFIQNFEIKKPNEQVPADKP